MFQKVFGDFLLLLELKPFEPCNNVATQKSGTVVIYLLPKNIPNLYFLICFYLPTKDTSISTSTSVQNLNASTSLPLATGRFQCHKVNESEVKVPAGADKQLPA